MKKNKYFAFPLIIRRLADNINIVKSMENPITPDNIAFKLLDIYESTRISHIIFESRFQRFLFNNSKVIKYVLLYWYIFIITFISIPVYVLFLSGMSQLSFVIFCILADLLIASIIGQILCYFITRKIRHIHKKLGYTPFHYEKTYFLFIIPEITIIEYTKKIYAQQANLIFEKCIKRGILQDSKFDHDFFEKCKSVFKSKEEFQLLKRTGYQKEKVTQAANDMLDIKLYILGKDYMDKKKEA